MKGAQGGIALPADPKPGMTYRQEYYKGEAEDQGKIVSPRSRPTCRPVTTPTCS